MKKILIIRNDKLGDFILALPCFAMLKQSAPDWEISVLVPSYTAPIAQLCPNIDQIIIDCGAQAEKSEKRALQNQIKQAKFDAVICLYSNPYNALLSWKVRIPYRLAPATKLIQFLYNHRLTQRRSRSEKPEFDYNLDLIRQFLTDHQIPIQEPKPPYLQFSPQIISVQKQQLAEKLGLDCTKKWFFIHAGTGGSAKNLTLAQYAEIAKGLIAHFHGEIILTAGGKAESEQSHQLKNLIADTAVKVYDKNQGLADFAQSVACADALIAGSTGPLHLAGALNIPTIGFFPSRLSAIPLRWQPISDPNRHLAFSPKERKKGEEARLMKTLIPNEMLKTIIPFLEKHLKEK